MSIAKLLLPVSLLVGANAVAAQTPPVAPVEPVSAPAGVQKKGAKLVCQTIENTGSRLGKRKVCHSQAEWAEQRALERRDIERYQANRGFQDKN